MLALTTKSRTGIWHLSRRWVASKWTCLCCRAGLAARSVALWQHSGGERSRRRNRSPRSELPSCGRPIPLLPQRPVHLAPLRRGFSLCPNIGNHLPRSRICFGAEERNSPRV